ncbi:MAG: hypothetical protein ABII90_15600 [Bacteroidota bacterium]
MKKKFQCRDCKEVFQAKPKRKEYISPIYGPCVSFFANCPNCSTESPEYIKQKPSKTIAAVDAPTCGDGSCDCPYA